MNIEMPEIISRYEDYLTVIQEKASSTVYSYNRGKNNGYACKFRGVRY